MTPSARNGRTRATVARMLAALLALTLGGVAGCATGKDAVGGNFSFVAPGGKIEIFYDPPASRGTVIGLAGESLLKSGHTIGLADFPGQMVVLNIWGSWCGPCGSGVTSAARLSTMFVPRQ